MCFGDREGIVIPFGAVAEYAEAGDAGAGVAALTSWAEDIRASIPAVKKAKQEILKSRFRVNMRKTSIIKKKKVNGKDCV
jgi:hypothetical protein